MFMFKNRNPKQSKCIFTHCEMPEQLHEKNLPAKKQPFSTIRQHPFVHTVDLILPDEVYEIVEQKLKSEDATPRYARVQMTLLDILSGEFFNQYIKTGNILMRSQGREGVDELFTLSEGVLRIEVDTPTYERCGLPGKPIAHEGRKHVKARYAIEYDLRHPSMLHGKKGFERLVWASKNVLNRKYTWLFVDLNDTAKLKRATGQSAEVESPTAHQSASPIHHFQQELKVIRPDNTVLGRCAVPIVDEEKSLSDPLYEEQLLEWLGLVLLDSPRVRVDDAADPYLCRYELPEGVQEEGREALMEGTLHHIQWKGFMPSQFVSSLLLAVKQETGAHWFGMNVSTFGGSAYTMICRNGKEILLWDLE